MTGANERVSRRRGPAEGREDAFASVKDLTGAYERIRGRRGRIYAILYFGSAFWTQQVK